MTDPGTYKKACRSCGVSLKASAKEACEAGKDGCEGAYRPQVGLKLGLARATSCLWVNLESDKLMPGEACSALFPVKLKVVVEVLPLSIEAGLFVSVVPVLEGDRRRRGRGAGARGREATEVPAEACEAPLRVALVGKFQSQFNFAFEHRPQIGGSSSHFTFLVRHVAQPSPLSAVLYRAMG